MHRVWRFVYDRLESDTLVSFLARLLQAGRVILGAEFPDRFIVRLEQALVYSGFPGHPRPWLNLHFSRFLWRLRRRLAAAPKEPKLSPVPVTGRPLRVGCFGGFSGLLSFPPEVFLQAPKSIELHLFDLRYKDRWAPSLQSAGASYTPVRLEGPDYQEQVRLTAQKINEAQLDLLVNIRAKRDAYDLLDQVTTPCIVHICTGSELLHHPKADFELFCQPEADYFVQNGRLFCGTSRTTLPGPEIRSCFIYFDPRGLLDQPVPAWNERQPLIAFHGALYKLASPELLKVIFGLLADDSNLSFVFMGKDNGQALDLIRRQAASAGVGSRVHYEGEFTGLRDSEGRVSEPAWEKMVSYLRRARLYPDTWPMCGASSRFEAYLTGAPVTHMGLRTDPSSWGHPQPAICDLPGLSVPAGTVTSAEDYRRLARRCLYEPDFSQSLVQAQLAVARKSADPQAYWQQILDGYHDWQKRRLAESAVSNGRPDGLHAVTA